MLDWKQSSVFANTTPEVVKDTRFEEMRRPPCGRRCGINFHSKCMVTPSIIGDKLQLVSERGEIEMEATHKKSRALHLARLRTTYSLEDLRPDSERIPKGVKMI